jgi:hypothetical protein
MENDLFDYLVDLERSLHKESTRKSKEKLDELLHDDFEEISASGKVYDKKQTVNALINETPYTLNAADFELSLLSKDIALLKYKTKTNFGNNLINTTKRSSLWKNEGSKWKMVFHQGTVVQES